MMEALGIIFIVIVSIFIIGGMGFAIGYAEGKEAAYNFMK